MPPRALSLTVGSLTVLSGATLLLPLVQGNGLAKGQDVFLHVGNVVECAYLLREGRLPILDWLPDIAGGRGGPNTIYYGTLGFFGPACLVNLGLAPEDSIRIWTGLVFLVGFLSAALFTSTVGGWLGGLAGGALFVFGPYFFSLPYSRAGYSEHMAYALYPLAFYLAGRASGEKGFAPLWTCAAVFTAIVATHTLSLAILTPFLILYFLFAGSGAPLRSRALRCAMMLGGSTVLMAPWWIGPILERGKILVNQQLRSVEAAESYGAFGIPWYSLFNQWFLDSIVSRCVPGRVHLLLLLAAGLVIALSRNPQILKPTILHLAFAVAALTLVEQSIAQVSVWLLPAFAYLQYPWRFLGIFNLFAAISFTACLLQGSPLSRRGRLVVAAGVPVVCVLIYLPQMPSQTVRGLQTRTREGIRESLTTLDHEDKYMPASAKVFDRPAPKALLEVPAGECFETKSQANDYRYRVFSPSAVPATFHQYFFDGWKAEIDRKPISIGKESSGLCRLEVPEGIHDVRLHFVRPPLHHAALIVSAAGWTALLFAGLIEAWRRWRRRGAASLSPGPDPHPLPHARAYPNLHLPPPPSLSG